MPADLTVLIALTPESAADDVSTTVASIRSEVGEDARICTLARDPGEDGTTLLGLRALGPGAALAGCQLLAFARAGDRWRDGAFVARRRPLVGHPDAVLSLAGHAIVAADGSELRVVRAPLPGTDPADLLLHPSIELSTVLVLASAVTPTTLSLLARPGGDTVLWARITREHGFLPSTEISADVPADRAVSADDASAQRATRDAARVLWEDEAGASTRLVDDELRDALAETLRLSLEIMVRDARIERLEVEAKLYEARLAATH